LKICLVTNIYEPYQLGGTEVYVKALTEGIRSSGHDIFVITTCPPAKGFRGVINETINGIPVYRFYPWNIYWGYRAQEKPLFLKPLWHFVDLWNPHVYFVVKNILSKELPDIVHINNMGGLSNSIFWACKGNGRRVVYTLHDYISICPKSILLRDNFGICEQGRLLCKVYQVMKRWSVPRRVDLFISPSSFNAELHKKHGFLQNGKYAVVPLGIEMQTESRTLEKGSIKNRAQEDCINILYLGQIVRHKGLSVLAQAFKQTKRKDLKLHIAGHGDYIAALQGVLRDCDNVTFHGYVSGDEKESLFLRSDVFVLPSICYDNAPVTIAEAYRYGLPVIGSNLGGIPEMIQENKTGFLFEAGNASALASIFGSITLKRLRNMAHDCQKVALTYRMENHLEKLLTIYSSLAG
jgi:glycosyltransferase involved in cell wall biosynthesis